MQQITKYSALSNGFSNVYILHLEHQLAFSKLGQYSGMAKLGSGESPHYDRQKVNAHIRSQVQQ